MSPHVVSGYYLGTLFALVNLTRYIILIILANFILNLNVTILSGREDMHILAFALEISFGYIGAFCYIMYLELFSLFLVLCRGFQVILKENMVLTLFRDEGICAISFMWFKLLSSFSVANCCNLNMQYKFLHEDYQLYFQPQILELKKKAKSGHTKQKEADLEYSVAKQVEKMIRYGHKSKFKYENLNLELARNKN